MEKIFRGKGSEVITKEEPLYKLITAHTARRTYVTICKKNKMRDAEIMQVTGHKKISTFNQYNIVTNEDVSKSVNKIFTKPKLKVVNFEN